MNFVETLEEIHPGIQPEGMTNNMDFFKDTKGYSPKNSEEEVLKFWQIDKTFEKSVSKKAPKGDYAFYDGPPFATGTPHYGHILAGTIKDVIPRYQTMQGKRVERHWGWDCHGLPIENIIEGELGLKTKKDIEQIGIEKFNEAARNRILSTSDEWEKIVPRVGRWVDMKNDYKTMQPSYMESVLWVFKTLHDKGLIYEGHKVMQICPRCETSLSNFEVSQGYKDITDISIVVKAKLLDKAYGENAFILAWTTTPWTLPGNVALAINPKFEYVLIEIRSKETNLAEKFILAKSRLSMVKDDYLVLRSIKGEDLIGKSYEPFFDYFKNADLKDKENAWKIYPANFVTDEDGTGVVHIAPAFGEDDMKVAHAYHVPIIQHVKMSGEIINEVKDFSGLQAKPKENGQSTDIEVIKWLAHNGKLFSKEKIVHSYPHCWRCDTPLLNYATSSWFVKVTDIKHGKGGLIENNKKINWVPQTVGKNRFGNWLKDARDWAISRSRFWGAPIPVWRCKDCQDIKVVGSRQEIKNSVVKSGNAYFVMRHGQAESNAKDVVSSNVFNNHHLTPKGKKQVILTAKKLKNKKIDLIIASDFLRTKETAQLVAKILGISDEKIIFDKRIWEIDCGDLNGKSNKDYDRYFNSLEEKYYKKTPNGEDLTDLKKRMGDFIYDIERKYSNKNILIVSHEYPIWNLFAAAYGYDPKYAIGLRPKKGEFIKNAELKQLDFVPLPHNRNYEFDLHRPYIDEIEFSCSCGGKMKRVQDVFDCWFESGSMPYGQAHYPFENKKKFENNFPAQFIAEGLDQTRGWFYTLLILSTGIFKKTAYKNVIVNGLILAEDGQKMSKKLKNYPDPMYLIDKYGADALRLYLLASPVVRSEDLNFSEKGVDEAYKKTVLRFFNVYSFYRLYVSSKSAPPAGGRNPQSKNILDRWIIARLNELILEVTSNLDKYELDRATRPIHDFVDDLSTWYLRRSRRRLQKPESKLEFNEAAGTLAYVLQEFAKVVAPFAPFIADSVYLSLIGKSKSVHLESWPKANKKLINKKLLVEMKEVRMLASEGLALRAKEGIKVRQPLASLKVKNAKSVLKGKKDLLSIIKDEVNIKDVIFGSKIKETIELDKNITSELYKEGIVREFIRAVQDLRQKAGYQPQNKINLFIDGKAEVTSILNEKLSEIKKEVNAKAAELKKSDKADSNIETNLDVHKIWIGIKK